MHGDGDRRTIIVAVDEPLVLPLVEASICCCFVVVVVVCDTLRNDDVLVSDDDDEDDNVVDGLFSVGRSKSCFWALGDRGDDDDLAPPNDTSTVIGCENVSSLVSTISTSGGVVITFW